jgi:mannonate dehydratase
MKRRDLFKNLAAGAGATLLTSGWIESVAGSRPKPAVVSPATIKDVKVILTAPNKIRLVVVKVITSEPGLYGVGCATFTQRALVVQTAIEQYLKPFLIGRNVDEIEDIWQSSYVSSYWRNGGVLFNAMSGIDMALWDIKGKQANMPVYQLLGGKVRFGADLYYHAQGADQAELDDNVAKALSLGYRYVRVQMGVKGYAAYGARGSSGTPGSAVGDKTTVSGPTHPQVIFEPAPYVRQTPRMFEHLRAKFGEEIELLHDVHERITLPQAIQLCKSLEQYNPYFIEDPFPPEQNDHFRLLRQQTSVPLSMGELFNSVHEYVPLIQNRLIDFIRIHISQIGGLSPARKVQALCEFFGVRTAWHGPGDASPIAHAAQLALELSSYNFGIHEGYLFPKETQEVFPGCPEVKDGYMFAREKPGLGIDIDEKVAAKFPFDAGATFDYSWGSTRMRDGTVIRP